MNKQEDKTHLQVQLTDAVSFYVSEVLAPSGAELKAIFCPSRKGLFLMDEAKVSLIELGDCINLPGWPWERLRAAKQESEIDSDFGLKLERLLEGRPSGDPRAPVFEKHEGKVWADGVPFDSKYLAALSALPEFVVWEAQEGKPLHFQFFGGRGCVMPLQRN